MPGSPGGPPLSPTALLPHGSCCSQNPHPECGLCPGRRRAPEKAARDGAGRSPLIPPPRQPRLHSASAFTPAGQTPRRSGGRTWGQNEDGNRAWPHGRGTSRQEGPALNARASTARPGPSLTPGISGCGSWGSQRRRGPGRGRLPPSGARFSAALLTCVAPWEWGPPTPPSPLRHQRKRPWHAPAGWGLQSSPVTTPPLDATAGGPVTGRVLTAWEKQKDHLLLCSLRNPT